MGPASVGVCWVRVAWLERNLRHPREAAAARWTGQGPPGSCRPFRVAPPGPPSPSTGPHSGARSCLQIRVTQGREEGAAGSGHRLAPHSQEGPIKDNRAAILLAGGHSAAAPFVAGKLRNPSFSGVPSGRSPCPHGHFTPDWPDPRPGRRCVGPERWSPTSLGPAATPPGPPRTPGDPAGADVFHPRRKRPAQGVPRANGGVAVQTPRVSSLGSRGASATWAGNRQPPPRPPRVESKGPGINGPDPPPQPPGQRGPGAVGAGPGPQGRRERAGADP